MRGRLRAPYPQPLPPNAGGRGDDDLPLPPDARGEGGRGVRGSIFALCLVVFLADNMSGVVWATFSLYAEELGASVVLVGVLTSLTGLTALVCSVPIGLLSDRIGRARVLIGGMALFALSMALFAIAPGPYFLIPGRLLLGVALVGSFWVASAYLGDVVSDRERGFAFGLLTTSMGLGFTTGPLIGGQVAEAVSTRAAYGVAVLFGVAGVVVVRVRLWHGSGARAGTVRRSVRQSLLVGRDRRLVPLGIAAVLNAIAFGGAVSTIFPLYAEDHGVSEAAIGTMFAVRAIASTVVRLPSGALSGIVGSRQVVAGALLVELIAVAGIGTTDEYAMMLAWLALEGIAYGAFLTSAQAYLAERTVAETRGAAIGFYSMTGGLGNTLAPLALGVVGAAFGLRSVFFVSGAVVALGLVAMQTLWLRSLAPAAPVGSVEG